MDSFFSLSLPIRAGVQNLWIHIPADQRGPNDTESMLWLPEGMHTIIFQWEGVHPRIYPKLMDGRPNGNTIAGLLGGKGSGQTIATVVVRPGGVNLGFQQNQAVSEEEANAHDNLLGVTVILGETRGA